MDIGAAAVAKRAAASSIEPNAVTKPRATAIAAPAADWNYATGPGELQTDY
jgi:hypothetical protein